MTGPTGRDRHPSSQLVTTVAAVVHGADDATLTDELTAWETRAVGLLLVDASVMCRAAGETARRVFGADDLTAERWLAMVDANHRQDTWARLISVPAEGDEFWLPVCADRGVRWLFARARPTRSGLVAIGVVDPQQDHTEPLASSLVDASSGALNRATAVTLVSRAVVADPDVRLAVIHCEPASQAVDPAALTALLSGATRTGDVVARTTTTGISVLCEVGREAEVLALAGRVAGIVSDQFPDVGTGVAVLEPGSERPDETAVVAEMLLDQAASAARGGTLDTVDMVSWKPLPDTDVGTSRELGSGR